MYDIGNKTEDIKMPCNKNLSKTSNKLIDTLEHVSSEEEVSFGKSVFDDDTDNFITSKVLKMMKNQ